MDRRDSNKSKAKSWLHRIFKLNRNRGDKENNCSYLDMEINGRAVANSDGSDTIHCTKTRSSFRRSLKKMHTSVKSCVIRKKTRNSDVESTSSTFNASETLNQLERRPNLEEYSEIESANKPNILIDEIQSLLTCCWYWGPMTSSEAEEMLKYKPDGTFLVRDSSSTSYLFSISFRSVGKTMHARIEYNRGKYNLYGQSTEGFSTISELIQDAIRISENTVYCYSHKGGSDVEFPVRLTKPISRYTHLRSLKYLCRFVIRQCTNINDIPKLPLPTVLHKYLLEGPYF